MCVKCLVADSRPRSSAPGGAVREQAEIMSRKPFGHSPEHIAEVRRMLASHRSWLEGGRSGRAEDFSYMDLSKIPLHGVVLDKARMIGTCLSNADLTRARLRACIMLLSDITDANLEGADLLGADMRGARLNGSNLSEANLAGADFRQGGGTAGSGATKGAPGRTTSLVDTRLTKALMMGARLENCDLTGAELVDADLSNADLSGAILVATDLSGVTLTNARLTGAVLSGATIDERVLEQLTALGCKPKAGLIPMGHLLPKMLNDHERWVLSDGRDGQRLDIDLADLTGADLSGRDLSGIRLQRCNLSGADFRRARLTMADLAYCCLIQADLSGADLSGCVLRRAQLRSANLQGAILDNVPIAGNPDRPWPTNLQYARLAGADFRCRSARGANLRDIDLSNAQFDSAILSQADLRGARLEGGLPMIPVLKVATGPALPAR